MTLTYKEFLKKEVDLAPLGIERRGNHGTYFCTPKGADIFGSAGVDGIHFCFIKSFGEMVFAVSPENDIGNYIHPIARNFEDLLSLLVSTSNIAAIEQAWMWNKERFYKFLQENSTTKEQEQVMWKLRHDLAIPFTEEPFDYIKELQSEFDYSKIKFTAEYYDVVGDSPGIPEETKEWQVFYGGGYHSSGARNAAPGTELALNKEFTWNDEVWHIPSMYLCNKGFVVDYCIEISLDKIKNYYNKWKHTLEQNEDISHEDMIQMDRENPFNVNARSHFMLNDKVVREELGSGLYYIPEWCMPSGVENPEKVLAIMEHYGLDDTKAWSFSRHSCLWAATRKPKEIKSFSLRLERCPTTIQGIHFKNPSVGDMITFTHPLTGTEHKLMVLTYEPQELSPAAAANDDFELPTHHMAMTYQIEPDLKGSSFAIRDCAANDEPKKKPRQNHASQNEFAACIGGVTVPTAIIGGADGPTAVIMAQPNGMKRKATLSALHFEPPSNIEWKMEFDAKMMEDIEITLI